MPLVTLPVNNIIVANGDYVPAKGFGPGRPISIELSGNFGGATVVGGFASSDAVPDFITDQSQFVGLPAISKTSPSRWTSSRPASGKLAFRVSGATGATAILVKIVDLPR
jgi:hypothetical protein